MKTLTFSQKQEQIKPYIVKMNRYLELMKNSDRGENVSQETQNKAENYHEIYYESKE